MRLINIHTGETLVNIEFAGAIKEIEFLEQLNDKILIKMRGGLLRIYNVIFSLNSISSLTLR